MPLPALQDWDLSSASLQFLVWINAELPFPLLRGCASVKRKGCGHWALSPRLPGFSELQRVHSLHQVLGPFQGLSLKHFSTGWCRVCHQRQCPCLFLEQIVNTVGLLWILTFATAMCILGARCCFSQKPCSAQRSLSALFGRSGRSGVHSPGCTPILPVC